MAHDDKKAPALFGEIAISTGGQDITRGFADSLVLQPGDPILKSRGGGNYKLYENLLTDWQVKSTFQQRRSAVISREWVVDAGGKTARDKKAADFIAEQLADIEWDEKTRKMLAGVFYGYAVAEMMWARDGRNIAIDNIKVRRRERFRFGQGGELRLLTRDHPDGLVMPPRKFWRFETGADDDDEPYGLGLGHWLYWPVFFKRNGLKFWLIFLEKFGAPTAVGKFPPNATPGDKEKLLAAVNAIQTDAGIIIPEGMMLELLEATRQGTSDNKIFESSMDSAISKVVLSQTMTTDDGSSRSQSETHMDVRQEVVKADSDLVCGSFNRGPVRWLIDWNYPGAAYPHVWRRVEDDPDLKPQAERDKLIFDMGYEPTPEYIKETYGDGFTKSEIPPPPAAVPPGQQPPADPDADAEFGEPCPRCGSRHFAEAPRDNDAIDDLAAQILDDEGWAELMEPLAGGLEAIFEEATSYDDLRHRLAEAIGGMDIKTFGERLARAGFAVRLAGGVGADLSDDESA